MPNFRLVPDWQSWVNQGADLAVADLGGGGQALVVLRVDHPPDGPNRAFYRVGQPLDATGAVRAWGDWMEIPGWATADNSDAGIAVARLPGAGDPAGRFCLVVLQVEHRVPGPNRGLLRVGRGLDDQGRVTAGWSAWQEVPDWASWRDQGAAVTIAELGGTPSVVVFHVDDFHGDNPGRPNKAFFRVGSGLTENATVAAWQPWQTVDWFSWFNQGGGVAVADLDGDGTPEIVAFGIDDRQQAANEGWYRVGWSLQPDGRVAGGWGPWAKIGEWDSWEDQGGGLALAALAPGRPRAVVLHVDNPDGLNQGRYAVFDLDVDLDRAAQLGTWRLLPYLSDVLPVHAALLHTGKLLFFAGSGNNLRRAQSPDFGRAANGLYTSVLWNPLTGSFTHFDATRRADGRPIDLFCCGHCSLPDGRLLVIGGTDRYDVRFEGDAMVGDGAFTGVPDALVFDPVAQTWTIVASMAHGRWYPTAVMRADGSVVALSGTDADRNTTTAVEQLAQDATGAWNTVRDFGLPLYPHLFVTRAGTLLYTGGKMDTPGDSVPLLFDPVTPTAAVTPPGLDDIGRCNQSASVILPPAQAQRFMILGGGPEDDAGPVRGEATQRTAVIDLSLPAPHFVRMADLKRPRMHVNAVLLPDGTVLAAGGGVTREASSQPEQVQPGTLLSDDDKQVFEAEIYDPATNVWTLTGPANVARLYHSVALLLPDGRVVAASGNPDKGTQVPWLPPDPREEMRMEIYSPPYLFRGGAARPVIAAAPAAIGYGSTITVATPDAARVVSACLVSPGVTTHSFNVGQRLVDAPVAAHRASELDLRIPAERTIAPPGWYMLFLVDDRGVPSVARWTRLG